jgi:hypothetical protein
MASHEPFGHLQHKLWSKEGPGVKLAISLPITKSRESTRPRCVQGEWTHRWKVLKESSKFDLDLVDPGVCRGSATHRWKALKESYKFALDLVPIGGWSKKLWTPKVPGAQIGTVSRLHFGSHGTKSHSGVGAVEQHREYYMGGRWWLPPSLGRGESSESKVARDLSQHQKGAEWVLTNLSLVLDARPSK